MARRFTSGKLRFTFEDASDIFYKQTTEIYDPISKASTRAIRVAADEIKTKARANIAAAGFGKRWQNALRVDTYPTGNKVSANAAALVFHKIGYADIFESGGTIRGRPLLWLPLRGTPKKVSTKRMTPSVFQQEIGGLVSITRGGKPLLGAPMAVSKSAARKGGPFKVTTAALRKGSKGSRILRNDNQSKIYVRTVPLFHGVRSVTLRKRFSIGRIVEEAAAQLPSLYYSALRDS